MQEILIKNRINRITPNNIIISRVESIQKGKEEGVERRDNRETNLESHPKRLLSKTSKVRGS